MKIELRVVSSLVLTVSFSWAPFVGRRDSNLGPYIQPDGSRCIAILYNRSNIATDRTSVVITGS